MNLSVVIPGWDRKVGLDAAVKMCDLAHNPPLVAVIGDKDNRMGVIEAMVHGADACAEDDIVLYVHNDVEVFQEAWDEELIDHFQQHPRCGLAGFGGALDFGSDDIYKTEYRLEQLIRYGFCSSMTDAEAHGTRVTVPTQVTFLDGFSLAFRRECYEEIGGWQAAIDAGLGPMHAYDLWAAIEVAMAGWEMWMVPISVAHHGGRTSTTQEYNDWLKTKGWNSNQELFEWNHRKVYELGRGVLPLRAPR